MKTTYYVENIRSEILGYFSTQRDAKNFIKKNLGPLILVKLRGQYFGEGYHAYKMIFNSTKGKFQYIK